MTDNSVALTPIDGNPFVSLTPVEGDPFQQNMALTDYARGLPTGLTLGQPGYAPLNDFAPAPSVPQPALPGLAGVAGDPSRSMAVRLPAAIGSSLADQGMGLAQSMWGAATLPGDVARGLVDPNSPEAIRRSTDLAGMLTLPAAGGEFNPDVMNAGPITAYHGSPHSFDQFDLSKIGTGEGAQAYGHGLYFAGNEDVAQYYKQALSEKPSIDGKPLLDQNYDIANSTGHGYLDKIVRESFGDMPLTRATLEANIQAVPAPTDLPAWQKIGAARVANSTSALAHLNDLEASGRIGNVSPGSMYQVAINADPDHFLDWDKPLSEQHPVVQQALANQGYDGGTYDLHVNGPDENGVFVFHSLDEAKAEQAKWAADGDHSAEIYPREDKPELTGAEAYQDFRGRGEFKQAGTPEQSLRDAGIPGIKYLDQGSRATGEGSRNYVVFNDKNIAILKKYGLAGLGIGAGGAALMGQNQPAQASGFSLTPVQGNPFAQ